MLMPDDRQQEEVQIFARLQRGEPDHFETLLRRKDGKLLNISLTISPVRDRQGRIIGGSKIARDITDRKNMEEALRKSEERLRLAIKATNDAIWDLDLKAGAVSWNDTYSMLYGRPETADSWQFWIDRIHPEDRARTVDGFQAAMNSGESSWSKEYASARGREMGLHLRPCLHCARRVR
jgi:PAS domain-containing protein